VVSQGRTALGLRRLKLRTFHAGAVLGFFTSYLLPLVQSVFFERLEAFVVCAGMVRGPEFRLSVNIPRRHQTALRGLAAVCPQETTASSLFPLFRGKPKRCAPETSLTKLALPAGASTGIEPAEPARCPQCGSVRRVRGEFLPRMASSPFVCAPPRDWRHASAGDTCKTDKETGRQGDREKNGHRMTPVCWSPCLPVSLSM
jgi:hypothetical protein